MSEVEIAFRLDKFNEGAIRFTRQSDIEKYGTIGPSEGTFVIPKSEFDNMLRQTDGNLALVEEKLGLKAGRLSNGEVKAIFIAPTELTRLRIPSGNELGVNSNWIPGGQTSGGVTEAVVDVPEGMKFSPIEF